MRTRIVIGTAALVLVVGVLGAGAPTASAQTQPREVHIGALLSLTGDGATLGNTSKAALEIATQRWNAAHGKQLKVVLDVENTNLEAEQAQPALTRLADRGARIVIGPQSSSEVAAISAEADARGVPLVSHGSTASSLGQPDDNVFRFVPTDRVEGRAGTDLMLRNGASVIVPMWRNDRGNTGLADSVRAAATASGAAVLPGVQYEPDTTDFGPALAELSSQLQEAESVANTGGGKVAVYLAGFEDVGEICNEARTVTGLDSVPWYGGDGSAQSKKLLASGPATFATSVKVNGYPSPLVALPADRSEKDSKLLRQISTRAKAPADAFTLAAYDAFDVATRALQHAGPDADAATLRAAFVKSADGFKGVTGTIQLDAAGDRVSAPYAFWSVCGRKASDARWRDTGTWTPAADATAAGHVRATSCPESS